MSREYYQNNVGGAAPNVLLYLTVYFIVSSSRKLVLLVIGVLGVVSALLMGLSVEARSPEMLFVGRAISGITIGKALTDEMMMCVRYSLSFNVEHESVCPIEWSEQMKEDSIIIIFFNDDNNHCYEH